jgi:hypothetical protein
MKSWQLGYMLMGGPKVKGMTGCSVVTPDGSFQLGSTGSAFVWEMFDAIAYDPKKFVAMLDNSLARYKVDEDIERDSTISDAERRKRIAKHHAEISQEIKMEAHFHMPPPGFTKENAKALFRLSGDLVDGR